MRFFVFFSNAPGTSGGQKARGFSPATYFGSFLRVTKLGNTVFTSNESGAVVQLLTSSASMMAGAFRSLSGRGHFDPNKKTQRKTRLWARGTPPLARYAGLRGPFGASNGNILKQALRAIRYRKRIYALPPLPSFGDTVPAEKSLGVNVQLDLSVESRIYDNL